MHVTILFFFFNLTPDFTAFTFILTKACVVNSNNISDSYIYTTLSYAHSHVTVSSKTTTTIHYVSSTTNIVYYSNTRTSMKQGMTLKPSF